MNHRAHMSALWLAGLALALSPAFAREIPHGRGFRKVPRFIGQPAQPQPLPPQVQPVHPHMAAQGRNGMHADSYSSGATNTGGPLGHNPQVRSRALGLIGGECGTVCFDSQGRVIAVSGKFTGMRLLLLDPETLEILAEHDLPNRKSNLTFNMDKILNDTSGGGYFHLDDQDRPVIANADRHLQIFEVIDYRGKLRWNLVSDFDLNPVLSPDALVTDAIPAWNGLIWFITRQGLIGTVDPSTGQIETTQLPGEEIQNSLAVAPDGVYLVSDHALYRFEANAQGQPVSTWRETYDRGTGVKPGSLNQGSGTTPTLLGDDLVAICDNADSQINVLVYERLPGFTGNRLIVQQPVFTAGASTTDNSLIGYDGSLLCVNNYGYEGPFSNPRTEPGIVRIDIAPNHQSWSIAWQSNEASQSTVPKLAIGNGLVYVYTRLDGTKDKVQAWYLTALDWRTGDTVFKIFMGTGKLWNNNYAPITLSPQGVAYIGCLNGIIRVRDGLPGEPLQKRRKFGFF